MLVQRVALFGHLGKDPEVRCTQNGEAVCTFDIATTEKWTQDGVAKEHTEWHRLVAWRKTAELVGKFLKKGSMIYVEGRLRTRKWDDKIVVDGKPVTVTRYSTEIVVDSVRFLGAPTGAGANRRPEPPAEDNSADGGGYGGGGGFGGGDDDIPF